MSQSFLVEKSVDFNDLNSDFTTLEKIYQKRLSYQKVYTDLNMPVPLMASSSNTERYAKVILYIQSEGLLSKFDEVVKALRINYDDEVNRLSLISSPFGHDDSWIQWDLAKQLYFFLSVDRSGTNDHYRVANPLVDEALRNEIISRHIGWEFWYSGGYEPWTNQPEIQNILGRRDKSPASWVLPNLGLLIRGV